MKREYDNNKSQMKFKSQVQEHGNKTTWRAACIALNCLRRGTTSQSDIKIGSSIAINVTDLNHKIIGLEHQLSEVSKHCHELASFESISRKSNSIVPIERQNDLDAQTGQSSEYKLCGTETKILYKKPEIQFKKSTDSDTVGKCYNTNGGKLMTMNAEYYNDHGTKIKKKKSKLNDCHQNLHKRETVSAYENMVSSYSTSSFHTFVDSRMPHYPNVDDAYNRRQHCEQPTDQHIEAALTHKSKVAKDKTKRNHNDNKTRKSQHNVRHLDQDFIADIIKRQYKPIKMFGRRESEISQFSAPVCRDQEYSVNEKIQEDPELCSCCYDKHPAKFKKRQDLNEMRSVCDARLYSAKKHSRLKHRRRHLDYYNDSELYDLVPVKEKSSPKSRKKFVEDTMMAYDYYREVPPSPRTLRPRLNLKTQYYAEFEDFMARKHINRKRSPNKLRRSQDRGEDFESDWSYEGDKNGNIEQEKPIHSNTTRIQKQQQTPQENVTVSSVRYPNYRNVETTAVDTPLNKTQDTDLSVDKTDKALCEIKDILQSFLQEIKKETTASQCDKSDVTSKAAETGTSNHQQNATASIIPNSGHSFNYSMAHCGMNSFMPPFTNPCCYPILPVCPMNCMQNGYIVPNQSITCATCANNKDGNDDKPASPNNNDICSPETEALIKEIYKYVAESPRVKKKDLANKQKEKLLTSRSIGGSTKVSKHDANVGTPTMRCYSKSCEAIGSRMISDAYYSTTNPTYSDTILEKFSLEATTDSISETDFTAHTTSGCKSKRNRFAKVLRSFGIKKKKKNIIEELSESESTVDVEVKRKPPPFRQNVTNCMMHGQEYYHQPPVPPMHDYQERHHEYQDYRPPYLPGIDHRPVQELYNPHSVQQQTIHEHHDPRYHPAPVPTAPPYCQSFDSCNHPPPNVPLCLKEIEVKSIGTQSERKMSFFTKMKTKMQVPAQTARSEEYPQKNCSTQTSQNKPGLFNWKNIQNKPTKNNDPITFSYIKQKQLAEGDIKMRDAMLKKLFYKKNPFSPRNLLVRTLLGKDKSSYGEPPMMYRPKMFF